ncbi:U1 small nuclear ribonucleoprotein A [Teratosphaeria destructans]|uniref:U1 small nuclear ribonucleoprotein A n=1 Tax=Teratosphaeria destructans TaxID=418781 RepID=A0A9W7SZT9_9PEZI|nr:U1 small nuclear ribonucleoprotein A [Teratosphaeria destructans]
MAAAATVIAPNQSLYIQNLPEKLQKPDLRRELYMLFSTYGPVLDITALKTKAMRGQAHILFKDVHCATQAMRACQGFEFFGRAMRISYSKNQSQTLVKMMGGFDAAKQGEGDKNAETRQGGGSFAPVPGQEAAKGTNALPPPPGLPAKVQEQAAEGAPSPAGQKRAREESDEEAPMDEDSEGAMDMSDDED